MPIASLPVELLTKICDHLSPQEWAALRLSCRALYENSLDQFNKTSYKRIRFMITNESLHELEKLAQSSVLREHVQELWMIPTVFQGEEKSMGEVSMSSKSCRQVKVEDPNLKTRHDIHKAILADHRKLLDSESEFVTRLRRCLDLFENLHTVGLAHYTTEFLLDPRQQKVRFLGRRQMMSRIDFRFDMYSLQSITGTAPDSNIRKMNALALSGLFHALSGSKCRPQKLHTCDPDFCGDIDPRISIGEEDYDSLLYALEDLKDLHLCIDLNEAAWAKLITKVAPQLERLTLSQDHPHRNPAKTYDDRDIFQKINFDRLRELHVHELDIKFRSLKALLESAKKSLNSLTLEKVIIRSDGRRLVDGFSLPSMGIGYIEYPYPLTAPAVPLAPGFHPFQPTSPSLEYQPTMPSYRPNSPSYHPTSPLFNPTPFFSPTSPSYAPTSPQFHVPVPPVIETEPPEHALKSSNDSPISDSESESESSEPMTAEYMLANQSSIYPANWSSIYHESPIYSSFNICPARPPPLIREDHPPETCVSALLDLFQNELSLEKLTLDEICNDTTMYRFQGLQDFQPSQCVKFDLHSSGVSFSEWASHLIPVASGRNNQDFRSSSLDDDEVHRS